MFAGGGNDDALAKDDERKRLAKAIMSMGTVSTKQVVVDRQKQKTHGPVAGQVGASREFPTAAFLLVGDIQSDVRRLSTL